LAGKPKEADRGLPISPINRERDAFDSAVVTFMLQEWQRGRHLLSRRTRARIRKACQEHSEIHQKRRNIPTHPNRKSGTLLPDARSMVRLQDL